MGLFFICLMLSSFDHKGKHRAVDYKINTIVIDAGHGGHDGGCSGKHSKEKHITLKIAKQLKAYIKDAFPNLNIILTREDDVFVELYERSAIANRNNADLFISIHCNSAPYSSAAIGTETYVMGLHKTESNLNVAKRENSVILEESDYAKNYDGFDPNSPMAHITFSLFQNAFQEQSIVFADLVEKQFSQRAGRKSRGVKQAGFLVLYKTAMPSVLIESGFLTNQSEEDFLKSTYGQEIISSAIYRAFKEYKILVEEKGNSPVVTEIEDIKLAEEIEPAEEVDEKKEQHFESEILQEYSLPEIIEQEEPLLFEPKEIDINFNKPVVIANDSLLVYKVQVFASSNAEILKEVNFDAISSLEVEPTTNGIKRYLAGQFFDYSKVQNYCMHLKENGFPDAFIVKYKNGQRLP